MPGLTKALNKNKTSYFAACIADLTTFTKANSFGFMSESIIVINDGAALVDFSFDGVNVHGQVKQNEKLEFFGRAEDRVYFKSAAGGESVRVFAWIKETQG